MDNELMNSLVECELWEYSESNYLLQKELTELTLIEKYIENININEYVAMLEDVNIPDSFYMEDFGDTIKQAGKDIVHAAADNLNQKASAAYMTKKDGLLVRITKLISKIAQWVMSFIGRVNETTAQYNKQSITLLERLQMVQLDAKDIRILATLIWNKSDVPGVNSAEAGVQGKLPLSYRNITTVKQPFEDKLQLNLASNVQDDDNLKAVKWALALGLSNETVVLNGDWATTFANEQTKQWPEAVSISFLAQKIADYLNAETLTQGAAIVNNLKMHTGQGNAITINVSNNNAENDKKTIEALRDKISNTATGGPDIKIKPQNAKEMNELDDQLLFLRTCASSTLRMYQTYIIARKNITSKLTTFLEMHFKKTQSNSNSNQKGND